MARVARVLRLARLALRSNRRAELERIFGTGVEVFDTALADAGSLRQLARVLDVDAIVLDVVAPPALPELLDGLGDYRVLRPTWVETRTSRGELQPSFAGYRLLGSDASLRSIDDGALVPQD